MKITIIGTGYVGLCTAVGFGLKGHDVTCVDVDRKKIGLIRKGTPPFYEPGLETGLKWVLKKGSLVATTDAKHVIGADVIFICVGTPSRQDGSIDLKYIKAAAQQIGKLLDGWSTIVVKSTVVPYTTENVVLPILESNSGRRAGRYFGLAVNPEFLREGHALEDFLHPDRIVIGQLDVRSGNAVARLYSKFDAPIIRTNMKTAEMIKYAANAFLAARISLINEIGNICKRLGIDVYEVARAIGYDDRIGEKFLNAGIGFGGSCFPKDVRALVTNADKLRYKARILKEILALNESQPLKIIDLLKRETPNLKGKTIAVLGLAFKPNTDDIREAPSIKIVKALIEHKAHIKAHDPKAIANFKKLFPTITYCRSVADTLKGAHACLILTEWPEYKNLTNNDFECMSRKIVIEGRKVLDPKKVSGYEGICW